MKTRLPYKKILALSLIITLLLPVSVGATEAVENNAAPSAELDFPVGGLLPFEGIEVTDLPSTVAEFDCDDLMDEVESAMEEGENFEVAMEESFVGSQITNHEWDQYASNYTYNHLSEEKKLVWKAMDALCLEFLSCNQDWDSIILGYIDSSAFTSVEEFGKFLFMYSYSNPQYFFLSNAYSYYDTKINGKWRASLTVYSSFVSKSARSAAVNDFKAGVKEFTDDIGSYVSDYSTLVKICQTVCDKVTYNEVVKAGGVTEEQTTYTQTAYSTFVLKDTVCAGYAKGTELLCNYYGINCVGVTSPGHAYNKVCVDDTWYNVDNTWADQKTFIYYKYMLKSDSTYSAEAAPNGQSHTPLSSWDGYLPAATTDSVGATSYVVPTVSSPTSRVAKPVINTSKVGETYLVNITTSTPGASIYYLLDGGEVNPEENACRCLLYSGTFTVDEGVEIKAIAIKNGYWDSLVVTERASLNNKVTYKANGGSGTMSATSYTPGNNVTLRSNSFSRTHHTFAGWNTEADGSGTAYADGATINSLSEASLCLYAQWTPIANRHVDTNHDGNCDSAGCGASGLSVTHTDANHDGVCDVSSCGKTGLSVSHTYAESWANNKTRHWHNCTAVGNGCSARGAEGLHVDANHDGICDICNRSGLSVTHTDVNHDGICDNCGTGGLDVIHTDANHDGICDEQSCQKSGLTVSHSYNGSWKSDATDHWKLCSCGAVGEKANHTDANHDGACDTCGKRGLSVTHSYSGDWQSDATNHWKLCDCGAVGDKASHTDANHDGTCDICGKRGLTVEHSYSNGKCTVCGAEDPNIGLAYSLTIKFNANGGSGKMKAMTIGNFESKSLTKNSFSKKGYTFAGWNTQKDGKGSSYSNKQKLKAQLSKSSTITLYAQWKANTYAIKFNANGGKGSMKNMTSISYGSSKKLTKAGFTRKGYTFKGWAISKANAKKGKVSYKDKASVKNLTTQNKGVVNLYAVWTKK